MPSHVEAAVIGKLPEGFLSRSSILDFSHGYQPPREVLLPASGDRLFVFPEVNEDIYNQVYKKLLVEGESLPNGFDFSLFFTLREWVKAKHPEDFEKIVTKVSELPNREYQVLGDPGVHVILPHQSRSDKDMLMKIGLRAFEDDFGFRSRGLWPPETAVSRETLDVAADNGYEFAVLRADQLKSADTNPVWVDLGNGKGIFVVTFDPGLNQSVSFEKGISDNADQFLDRFSNSGPKPLAIASDMERWGHHVPLTDQFITYLFKPTTLEKHGFAPFNIKSSLDKSKVQATEVRDNTSWSCAHNLGRWTGECDDDINSDLPQEAKERIKRDKANLYSTLTEYGTEINIRLDVKDANWREKFVDFFISNRSLMFDSGVDATGVEINDGNRLFWAKYCELVGKTSCGWFFGAEDRPERAYPRSMIGEIEKLVPDINEHTVFEDQAA